MKKRIQHPVLLLLLAPALLGAGRVDAREGAEGFALGPALLPLLLLTGLCFGLFLIHMSLQNKKIDKLTADLRRLLEAHSKGGADAAPRAHETTHAAPSSSGGWLGQRTDSDGYEDECADLRMEALCAGKALEEKFYPLLSHLKDWLRDEAGRQRFLALCGALSPEKAKAIFAQFPKEDLEKIKNRQREQVPKATSYGTLIQASHWVSREVASKPAWFLELSPLWMIHASDAALTHAIEKCEPESAALCLNLASTERAMRILENLPAKTVREVIRSKSKLEGMGSEDAGRHLQRVRDHLPPPAENPGLSPATLFFKLAKGS